MPTYEIDHIDADCKMLVEADTAAKARYKNFRGWREAFGRNTDDFKNYVHGIKSCRKVKGDSDA